MAHRLTLSTKVVGEIGEAYEWYQAQLPGLGTEFLDTLNAQFGVISQSPQLYAEVRRGIRRALLPRFPYGVFYAAKGDIVSVLGVIHSSRSPRRWPRT